MSKRGFTYILFLSGILTFAACSNEYIPDGGGELHGFSGTVTFNLSAPDASVRTRAVSTQSGAEILINNLWIGVFNATTGACFGAAKYDDMHKSVQSGALVKNMVGVDFVARDEDLPLAYVVAAANYDGVVTWDGLALSDILPDFDHRADITWDDLVNLGIDTRSAYAGSKGEDENSGAPFLAGFFQDAVSLTQNPKIDQFSYASSGPAAIYPAAAAAGMDIRFGDSSDDKIYAAAGAICLRRLVSHNTIHLRTSNGYEVTELRYKRFNMPRAVFMLQRRTDTNRYSDFEEWQRRSPNFADRLLTADSFDTGNPDFPYSCDTDWIPVEVNSWDDRTNIEFAFDHFENKHWGAEGLKTRDDREARNEDGTFAALCSGNGDSFNDFASYFVLRMHLVNKSTGESADTEYTIHEGFCNDDDGRIAESQEVRCRDFSSFRNVNYNYNINISGTKDITANVTSSDGSGHSNGQSGTIWKMNYATGTKKSPIPVVGGVYDFNGDGISLSDSPDIGFRIYGRDDNYALVDVCYNVPDGMYEGFAGLWPAGDPVHVDSPAEASIPKSLLESMRIGSGEKFYTLTEFASGVQNRTISPADRFSVMFESYDNRFQGMSGNFMRGIYIFDRNDDRNASDADGCSACRIAYGAEQYPFEPEEVRFDINKILWDNTYYKSVTTMKNLFAAASPIFYGAESSAIDLRWEHDPRFAGYRIIVFNDTYTHPAITVGPDRLDDYLRKENGRTVFVYPLNTAAFPRSSTTGANNYSFSVTPIVDEDIYKSGGTTVVAHDKTTDANCIRVCPPIWETSTTTDWKGVMLAGLTGGVEIHYRGLGLYCTSDVGANYNDKNFICFGGTGNAGNRYFSFVASVPGRLSVTCKSHSSATDRLLVIARMDGNGSQVNDIGERYDEVYVSESMATTKTTYSSDIYPLDGKPTEFRIYARGSIDYYKFQFTPAD